MKPTLNDIKNEIINLIDKSEYNEASQLFADFVGLTMEVKFLANKKHFTNDKDTRDVYTITLIRGSRKYTFDFGNSIVDSGFYFKYGKNTVPLDRKHLGKRGQSIESICRLLRYDFNPNVDKVHYPKEPTLYDVLACLQKYDVGSFEDFCSDFGYYETDKNAEKTYKAVLKEYESMCTLFSDDELSVLSEIS